jgi:hypothetical protein
VPRLTAGVFLCSLFLDLILQFPEVVSYDVTDAGPVGRVTEIPQMTFHIDSIDTIKIKLDITIPIEFYCEVE